MTPRRVLVVGNGMAGARLAEDLRHRDPRGAEVHVTVVGEEAHPAYNRILLSNVVAGSVTPRETRLKPDGWWDTRGVEVRAGQRVVSVDLADRRAQVCRVGPDGSPLTETTQVLEWDELVLATGSTSFIPPVAGLVPDPAAPTRLAEGAIAFRTVDDCTRIVAAAESAAHAVVLGGGLLGIEAARGLLLRGLDVTVVHPAAHPMDRQLDSDGGAVFARVLRQTGGAVVLGRRVTAFRSGSTGLARSVVLDDGTELPCDLLVVTTGIAPRVDLARAMGAQVGRGVVVDDQLRTSLEGVWAVGECVEHRGVVHGLVQPGWEQASVLADVLTRTDPKARYEGTRTSTRLKAHDIDLASMGDITSGPHDVGHEVVSIVDPSRGRYAKLVLCDDRIVGAIMLGGGDAVGAVTQLFDSAAVVPTDRVALLLGRTAAGPTRHDNASLARMPGSAVICRCNSVTKQTLVRAWTSGATTAERMAESTRATTGCGGCRSAVEGICGWLRAVDDSRSGDVPEASSDGRPDAAPLTAAPAAALTEGAA